MARRTVIAAGFLLAIKAQLTPCAGAESDTPTIEPWHVDFADRDTHAAFHNDRGLRFYQSGRLDKAIEELSAAIELHPVASLPYYNRGNAHFRLRQFERAAEDYSQALSRSPDHVMALVNRGSARSALGRLDEALADYNAAFAREPDNSYVLFNRGFLRGKRQEYREAIADFTRVIERDPNDGDAYRLRAAAYASLGEMAKALRDRDTALTLGPSKRTKAP
ncbi:MAG: tetratricopeptide repeat protein [Hyphomicrobium sp.]|jgi:tetratricopeptide (TPR) repeat protein|uniref:tetratricopeptide repeat protein n=1 Tax=Hyphomicrobium sp. DMF-1 TaxID=3019544 RepID=UPI000BD2C3FA|nr:tetratricopeptide repeat protein [Hyphomicrobium sp. DMF-1]MBN8910883.1 tetratricopeptide repeat protein [Hyphomicrobiales bacterium]OYW53701.1 MAG: hypothetical protein B7Z29_14730 [Hyphomicrobium sp. 12-62-95]OYX98433.1 MAG: hypothetical protein B7Y80_15500 [Hyphomicrobium sp. 32-62-53]WBT37961.1 tetratricopeptide repeat protein [Hyphomicrobium sp. DMF-1]